METFLLIVTITSLAGAAGMSIVAWKLLSDSRSRSAIRVATLQSLAFAASDDDSAVAPVHATPGATTAPMRATARFAALDSYEAEAPEAIEASAAPSPSFVAPIVNHDDPEMWDVTIDPAPRVAGATSPRTAVDARMFEPCTPVAGAGLRYAALGGLAAIVAAVAGTAYAVRETHAFTGLSFTQAWTTERARESSPQPLELISLRHTVEPGGAFTVTGLVQNPTNGRPVSGAVAVVYLFDAQGRYFATGRVSLDQRILQPGNESPFSITVAAGASVSRYRIGFRREDGAVVSHVDRRSQAPAGTTEEGTGSTPPDGVARRPRSAEG